MNFNHPYRWSELQFLLEEHQRDLVAKDICNKFIDNLESKLCKEFGFSYSDMIRSSIDKYRIKQLPSNLHSALTVDEGLIEFQKESFE